MAFNGILYLNSKLTFLVPLTDYIQYLLIEAYAFK